MSTKSIIGMLALVLVVVGLLYFVFAGGGTATDSAPAAIENPAITQPNDTPTAQ